MKLHKYLLILIFVIPVANADSLESEKLHTALITTAIEFDVFNQRCRGVSMAKKVSKVNRLYLRKYDITVNNYIKVYLSQDPRDARKNLKNEMIRNISKQGGCLALKKKGMRKQFKQRYQQLFKKVELSAWIPEQTRKR